MKVIFVIPQMSGGGAERVISILANNFVKKNIDVEILMTAGSNVDYALNDRVSLETVGGETQGSPLKMLGRIRKMSQHFGLPENKDAVIVSFGPGTSGYVVLSLMGRKRKLIISERNDPDACPHPHLRNIVYKKADKLVFQTYMARDAFPSALSRKGVVIPNPIRPDIPNVIKGEREKTIVAVGRLEKQKNYPMLLRAFEIFHKDFPDYTLHIFGRGSLEEELKKMAYEELTFSDTSVIFEDFCNDVNERVKNAGMYMLSSDYEGISNAMIEALAMGIPTVATDCPIGGSAMCIRSNENGILVPTGDYKAMANAMKRIAEDDIFAEKISNEAVKIRKDYNEDTVSDKWIELL